MSSLTTGDVRRILDFLLELHTPCNLETLPNRISTRLSQVIPSVLTGTSQVNFRELRVSVDNTSRPQNLDELEPVFHKHFHQHPFLTQYAQLNHGQAYRISDFLSENQLHCSEGLYQLVMRPLGLEDQMAIFLPTLSTSGGEGKFQHDKGLATFVFVHRDKRDFSERDRLVFNLLSPHLFQAYQNASAFTQLQQQLSQSNRTMEQLSLIVLNADGTTQWMAQRAWGLLSQYFQVSAREPVGLPDRLQQWVRHQINLLTQTDDIPAPVLPLRLEQDEHQLVIRLIVDRPAEQYLLLLDEQPPRIFSAETLEWLGLTKREAEVLFWVAKDKSNKEIAVILNCSDKTVKKHLEHIYEKLGVQTRAGAVVQALSRLGMLNQ